MRPTALLSEVPAWARSLAVVAFLWALTFPLWAVAPQTGDAAEQIMTALRGGVLHPPGFPLQAWLDRAFVLLPFGTPSQRLACLNSLGYAWLGLSLLETMRLLECDPVSRVAGAAAALFFPMVWFLGVHPEVFSWAHTFIALLIQQAVSLTLRRGKQTGLRDALQLGTVLALALAQHPVTVVALPAALCSAYWLLVPARARGARLLGMSASFLLVFALLYSSLILLGAHAIWPNWGPPRTLIEVWRHLIREEYGSFTLGFRVDAISAPTSALGVVMGNVWESWHVTLLLLLASLPRFVGGERKFPGGISIAVLGTAGCGVLFLGMAKEYLPLSQAQAYLERFAGVVIVPSAIVLGVGASTARQYFSKTGYASLLDTALLLFVAVLFASGWGRVDGSRRLTNELFRQAIALDLPSEALYVSASELESFYGAPTTAGVRFPVEKGLMGSDWYRERVIPRIEPRLGPLDNFHSLSDLVDAAAATQIPLASVDILLLAGGGRTPELRGLVFVLDKNTRQMFGPETVASAIRLCSIVSKLEPLPPAATDFEVIPYRIFARAFYGAAEYLQASKDFARAQFAREIFHALKKGSDAESWRQLCRQFAPADGIRDS